MKNQTIVNQVIFIILDEIQKLRDEVIKLREALENKFDSF